MIRSGRPRLRYSFATVEMERPRPGRPIRRLLGLLAASALVAACSEGLRPTLVDEPPLSRAPTSTAAITPAPEPPPAPPSTSTTAGATEPEPSRRWTLLAGGDVLMDRTEPAGIDPFAFIEPSLASADIAVINSEMAISSRGTAADKQYVFRAPPSAADRIAAAGIDVANLANNHARDYGPEALVDTVALLEGAGVVGLGAGADDAAAYGHRVLQAGDVRVAFVGTSLVVPRNFPAGPDRPGIASAHPTDRTIESVRAAAEVADVVIVVVHWGVERWTCPTAEQRGVAREFLGAGADAVIGQHPHVLQPVEFDGEKLVAYSLGNFVWHPRQGVTGETGVLQIDFDGDRIVGWAFHPHLLDGDGAPRPVAEGDRFDRITEILSGDCASHMPPPPTAEPTEPQPTEPQASTLEPTEPEPSTLEPTEPEPATLEPTEPEPAEPASAGNQVEPAEDTTPIPQLGGASGGPGSPRDAALVGALDALAARAPTGGCLAVRRGGETVFSRNAEAMLIPASLQKLVLAEAALAILGAGYTFTTVVLADAPLTGDILNGDLYLVGGGDPLLSTPDFVAMLADHNSTGTPLADLAAHLTAAGLTGITGGVVAVADRYDTLIDVPTWPARFAAQSVAGSLSAISVNQGWQTPPGLTTTFGLPRHPNPALRAAEIFDDLLEVRSVRIPAFPRVASGGGDYSGLVVLAALESAPLAAGLHLLLTESDNTLAEMLLKEIGLVAAGAGTSAAGARAVHGVLAPRIPGLSVPADGSGLSPSNRLSCSQVTDVLALGGPGGLVAANLAVAGRSGTLENPYRNSPAKDLVRAKTGSLNGVAALAGFAEAPGGDVLSFAMILNSGGDWIDQPAALEFFAEVLEVLVTTTAG